MIKDKSGGQLKDYKVFNFNGDAKIIQVDYDRFTNHKRNLYTVDWQLINAEIEFPSDQDYVIERPKCLNELLFLSNVLSADIPHVRTDFYIINDRIYFGELTFHHGSGFESFSPKQFGIEMGNMLKI